MKTSSNKQKTCKRWHKRIDFNCKDLTYYGLDIYKKRHLAELLKALVKVEGIEWIRCIIPFTGFPMDVLEVMKQEPKVYYLDIPLEDITDSVLKSVAEERQSKPPSY